MYEQMTARQRSAWMVGAGSVPAVVLCAGISWQWALLGGATAAAVLGCGMALLRRSGMLSLGDGCVAAFGKPVGTAVRILAAAWLLLVAARLTRHAGRSFPETSDPVGMGLATLALAAWACRKGSAIPARCAGVIALALGGSYAVLLLPAAGQIQIEWLRPWGNWRDAVLPAAMLLLPGSAWYLAARPETERRTPALGLLALLPAALAAIVSGCLSPRLAAAEGLPFYETIQGLRLDTAINRLEPLASAAMLLGYFCGICLLLRAAREAIGGKERPWQMAIPALAGGGASFWADSVPEPLWTAGAAIFWGILPLLIPLVVDCKKAGKKTKIKLDKTDSV